MPKPLAGPRCSRTYATLVWLATLVMPTIIGFAPRAACSQSGQPAARMSDEELLKYCLIKEGNAERGRALFSSDALSCHQCHAVTEGSHSLGPTLANVGDKLGRRAIVRAILDPSESIADGYEQVVVETTAGQVVVGMLGKGDEATCEIVGPDGSSLLIPYAEVEERRPLATSAMPLGFHTLLTHEQLNDVVEYLVSLRQHASSLQQARGMPREIPTWPTPVTLIPLLPESMKFDQPAWMVPLPDPDQGFLVLEHQKRIVWRLEILAEGRECRKEIFLDLGAGAPNEGRLTCLALHPDFKTNRRYYLHDRERNGARVEVVIGERTASPDGSRDAGGPTRELLRIPQTTLSHFGGWIGFGPDGYLYVSSGDSGPQEDPLGNAQNQKLLLGKILRIDVDRTDDGRPYAIPDDNPFLGHDRLRPEVWALGFRAPWRCCFDRVTGDFWVADVGQDRSEEAGIVRRGENHGWNVVEGFAPFSNEHRRVGESYTMPVFAYGRRYGPSITGGFVYRGSRHSALQGRYVCGDFESRRIFAVEQHDRELQSCAEIGISPQRIVSFAEDNAGELYVIGYEGMIYRIEARGQ